MPIDATALSDALGVLVTCWGTGAGFVVVGYLMGWWE